MGAKLSFLLLEGGDAEWSQISSLLSDFAIQRAVQTMDVHFHPTIDLAVLFDTKTKASLTASFVAVRAIKQHPGPTALAHYLSAQLSKSVLAIEGNDFYQSGGFQLWEEDGSSKAGLYVDHGVGDINYANIAKQGLEIFFQTELHAKDAKRIQHFLLEEILSLADQKPGADHRIIENGKKSVGDASDSPLDWDWLTGSLEWPMNKHLAQQKRNQGKLS